MSLAEAQFIAPTVTPGAPTMTQTFPYTPLGVNNICHMIVDATTASRTLQTCTSSGVSWTITTGTPVALNSSNHLYSVPGIITAAALQTVTMTFSGTPGTVTCQIIEYTPTIPGLVSWTYVTFTNNNGTSATAVTGALAGGQINDAFLASFLTANAITGNSNAQGYLTYDQTNGLIYGQLTSAVTVPATGFTQTSALFYAGAVLLRPTISLTPTKVPQLVSPYQGMF